MNAPLKAFSYTRVIFLTMLTMTAFAGNSLLCRMALKHTSMDAASFTAIRLISGAVMLWLLAQLRHGTTGRGNWRSAFALFAYAAGFSFAYISLPTATGALLLFGAVQVTMIGYGIWLGEQLTKLQILGLFSAFGGLIGLLLPGLSTPPLSGSLLMLGAGAAWGVYSLRGREAGDPIKVTAGNFMLSTPMAIAMIIIIILIQRSLSAPMNGIWYAASSGAFTSGVGYAIWYTILPELKATHAAIVQLSVPVIAALGGVLFLGEAIHLRIILASVFILGGIALVIIERRPARNVRKT